MLSRLKDAGLVWPTLLALPALALLIGLGSWQLNRLSWKEEILATVAARAKAPPLPHVETLGLACRSADEGLKHSCEYRRVRLEGRFEHTGERHVFAGAQGSGPKAEVGYWVFTPFLPSGGEAMSSIYVNRGFVPERLRAAPTRAEGQLAGNTEIVAQVRTREARPAFAGANDTTRNIYFVRNPSELSGGQHSSFHGAALLGNPLFYLEIVDGLPPGGYPRPLAASVSLPNRHLEYAVTWYGLALTLIGVYSAFARSRLVIGRVTPN